MTDEDRESMHLVFRSAVGRAGSQKAFERMTGAKQQKVSYWLRDRMILPAEYVLKAEAGTGISRHELRPDVYGPEPVEAVPSNAPVAAAEDVTPWNDLRPAR